MCYWACFPLVCLLLLWLNAVLLCVRDSISTCNCYCCSIFLLQRWQPYNKQETKQYWTLCVVGVEVCATFFGRLPASRQPYEPEYDRKERSGGSRAQTGSRNMAETRFSDSATPLNTNKIDTQIFEIPFLGWATVLRSRPIFGVFAIFVKFGLPYLGRYESCPGTIMTNDSQLGVLLNCQSTELYSWNCPRHEWSNFRKSSISDEHASGAILDHVYLDM